MQQPPTENGTPDDPSAERAVEEPQRRDRQRSWMLGEPAGIPPGNEGLSDGSQADHHEQVPNDGKDHWRR
jgi:hypothetical protein